MKVSIAIALPRRQEVIELDLPAGSTVADAVSAANVAQRYPEVEAAKWRTGIWSVERSGATVLREGDRVELYRELQADAKQMRRERVKVKRATRSRSGS
ncbi:RnfH family protein [Usitatibacter palustris]|uniref:UPF0125 protein DSM104440_01293 n=1 Tax=Usitatibacter palustris TaxID=2732487 RepID=A0A6M4H5C8_9PROT|nr:RnfH family protein [Usitatibacter palustris]QJR14492.1 hypothetical protein DSM104440_01293 [Usitatibacter palustris]